MFLKNKTFSIYSISSKLIYNYAYAITLRTKPFFITFRS